MVVMKTSSCFSEKYFLRISSVSVEQQQIYATKYPKVLVLQKKLAAPDHLEKMEIPTDLSIAENSTNAQQRRNLVQENERIFEQLSEDQTPSKLCSDAGLTLVERGQYFKTLETEEGQQVQH